MCHLSEDRPVCRLSEEAVETLLLCGELSVRQPHQVGSDVFVLHLGITPLGNDPEWFKIARVLSGNVPQWGQYPVGVFPGCNTKTRWVVP